ncbi:hypothetical protein B566_EDAN015786, partial [Ephemera danica]
MQPLIFEKSDSDTEKKSNCNVNRIVNIHYFTTELLKHERFHQSKCTGGKLEPLRELKRSGLQSAFLFACDICHREWTVESQPNNNPDFNTDAVWGSLSSGIGHTQLKDIFSTLNVRVMGPGLFSKLTTEIKQTWTKKLEQYIIEAGKIERERAIERGDVDPDGIPFITVILDGGWSKRSYGHNYSAHGAVLPTTCRNFTAVIIGAVTQKILYYGVLGHNCARCSVAERMKKTPAEHDCPRNFEGPSTAMEWNIVVSGFNCSEEMHGLRYKCFIADGDANVYYQIRLNCPYGRSVIKIQCANHKIRCFTSNLHKIATNTALNVQGRKYLKSRIPRLSRGARSAIRYCNQNNETAAELRFDFENLPHHVFGDHAKCRPYIQEHCKLDEENLIPFLEEKNILREVKAVTKSLINNANTLILNLTSNAAENLFSLTAKTNNGKRVDYTRSNQYETRVTAACLNFQKGSKWAISPYKSHHEVSPGQVFKDSVQRKDKKRKSNAARSLNGAFRSRKPSAPADQHYGAVCDVEDVTSNAGPPVSDLDDKTMLEKCSEKLQSLQVTVTQRDKIERDTVGQSDNPSWQEQRADRLTASSFHLIVDRRKEETSALVQTLLYKKLKGGGTDDMKYGKINESRAIERFTAETGIEVSECGLFVSLENGCLGASPDGLVGSNAIVEVKCIPSVKEIGLRAAASDTKHRRYSNFCLRIDEN